MLRTVSTPTGDRETMTMMTTASPSPGEKREVLEEVLQSASFIRADQLRNFLRYICEMEIAGRASELCEFRIGIEAFGRSADYSPIEDGIVRRRAVNLREKLHEVYATELAHARIRIELPKGRYVPRFVRVEPERALEVVPATILPLERSHAINAPAAVRFDAAATERRYFNSLSFAVGLVFGALLCAVVFLVFRSLPASHAEAAPLPATPSAAATAAAIPVESGVTYEAEAKENILNGRTEPSACTWCSGGNRVRYIGGKKKNFLVLNNIIVSKSGNYEMVIYYLLNGARSFFISVNDGPAVDVPVKGSTWLEDSRLSMTVSLKAGSNHIKFYNDTAYAPDLDRIVIR